MDKSWEREGPTDFSREIGTQGAPRIYPFLIKSFCRPPLGAVFSVKGEDPMENEHDNGGLEASFDIVARQDAVDSAIGALRGEFDEIKSRIERIARAPQRPMLGGAGRGVEMKGFVDGYLRAGRESELKSINELSPSQGGYLVPTELDKRVSEVLLRISPIRRIAQVVQTSTSDYRKLISLGGTASGWVSETGARGETNEPTFAEIIPPHGELYANPSATQAMLDDSVFDLEAWLANEIAQEFARAEGAAFVNGTGTNQPSGLLNVATSAAADGSRPFGTVQYVPSGSAAGFDSSPDLHLIDMVMALHPSHRQNAVWVMNASTLASIRKLKDTVGDYLWQPGIMDKAPDRLLGYAVVEAADMPNVAAGASPIAFGNFEAGYLITERTGTRILRDPFSNKPFVSFYATKRVGGQVLDSNAIKLMTIAAS